MITEIINQLKKHKLLVALHLILLVIMLFRPYYVLSFFLTALNAVIVYIKTKNAHPVDYVPTLFIAVIISILTGFYGLLFFVIAGVALPTIVTGIFGPESMIFWVLVGVYGAIAMYIYPDTSIQTLGVIISVIKSLVSVGVNKVMGAPVFKTLTEEVPNLLLNLFLFLEIAPLFF